MFMFGQKLKESDLVCLIKINTLKKFQKFIVHLKNFPLI